ncbi:sterol desaturase family protein [Sorangium sp. So ce693]|uniref:sterol desaturase family protein n=1 Tax=unclassified Sorangium TaxID=2621164 RepID=UPI003F5D5C7D
MTVTSTERTARPATCQMFETPLIERFSRIHPITPFVFWLPVYSYLGVRAARHGVGLLTGLGLVLVGLFLWTLAEYVLHRYVFHYVGPRLWQRRMHFVLHGVHHDFPQDADRLVMPLGASIPLGIAFYTLFRVVFGPVPADPLFVGFGLGYLAYDGTHYAIHHFRMSSRWGKWIKRHHMVHHHTGENARWGVSSPLWDWIFGTMGTSQAGKGS